MDVRVAAQYRIAAGCTRCLPSTLCPDHSDAWTTQGFTF